MIHQRCPRPHQYVPRLQQLRSVGTLNDAGIVTRGNELPTQPLGIAQSHTELDLAIAEYIRVRRATCTILGKEIREDALAVLAGVLLGQQITGPVGTLTEAAEKLGQGDFSTSIPVGGTKEVGKLARTMEDMRNNLVELTGTLRRRKPSSRRSTSAQCAAWSGSQLM